tara:strand:- start:2339 stop:3334 length:996 start_codon:yes stop_codon:yes gene_type:complete
MDNAPIKTLNNRLNTAKSNKNDDFYTQLTDIEKELRHYKKHFKNKIVLCNCDDPRTSNFFHYFSYNFEQLGLKKLITTCYRNTQADLFSKDEDDQAVMLEYEGDKNGNKIPDPEEIGITVLKGDGDFRSDECIEILKNVDIVVTNPPFSLFREYILSLVEHKKHFLIIGNLNAITYKEIFPLIKDNKLWLGVDNGGTKWFEVQDNYEIKTESRKKIVDGKKYFSMGNVAWYTNLEHKKRNEELILYKKYSPPDYPIYDNYDAIHIPTVLDIPIDYEEPMAVPITFMDKYNPNQFEILGNLGSYAPDGYSLASQIFIDGKKQFKRLLIRIKK